MIIDTVAVISDFSILIPLFLIFINLNREWNDSYQLYLPNIIVLVVFLFFRNAITEWMNLRNENNIYIYNWYNYFSFFIITSIYFSIEKNRLIRALFMVMWVFFTYITFAQTEYLFDTETIYFHRVSYNFSHGFITIIVLVFFYNLITRLQVSTVLQYPLFWFSTGTLFYYSGTFFLFLLIQELYKNSVEMQKLYWMIDALLSILFNVFLGFTVWFMGVKKG